VRVCVSGARCVPGTAHSPFPSGAIPVMTHPIVGVIVYMLLTLLGSINRSGTFFCVTIATLSFPRHATDVRPEADAAALKAYSIW